LDRDGVINEATVEAGVARPPSGVRDVVIPPDVAPALDGLREAKYLLVMVTNQPDVARGTMRLETVEAINDLLVEQLGLDAVYVCVHDDSDGCDCRKPKPGMLVRAAQELDLDLGRSWLIGDRWVDIGAADAAGVRGILLEREYSWRPSGGKFAPSELTPFRTVTSISDGARVILDFESPTPLGSLGA
jgi:D-glycero-D-manno-heptose 1,7-bisphosphate phosphatase